MSDEPDPGQLGDMDLSEFRAAAHDVADRTADYLERLESFRVVPDLQPGDVRARIPRQPPEDPEPLQTVLDQYKEFIEPNITHWQHPGFMAYFPSVALGPAILGEWLAAGLNSNVMFWKNAPASTELEERVVQWLRSMLGLPDRFDGMLTDTASISSLLSLVAARHAIPGLQSRDKGLAGRAGVGRLRLYASTEAHSSIEKAAIVIGVGREGLRRIEADRQFRMIPAALERAIAEDRAAGWQPFCVVATLGTTSSTSVDPADALATICEREALWLHVDAAYGGAAALLEEKRELFKGWERANTIVFNPHKWMFTAFDASLLLFRDEKVFRDAFSLVPEYLRDSEIRGAHNYSEYGVQLGRRFRALKLWMMIRFFGTRGIADRIRQHCRMAQELRGWIESHADWEILAPVPFSTVCLRYRPSRLAGRQDPGTLGQLEQLNQEILERVNLDGRFYLSATRLADTYTLRVALGNPRQTMDHVRGVWEMLKRASLEVDRESVG